MNRRKYMVGVLLMLSIGGCSGETSAPLPDDVIQVWRNPAPGYRDRSFEIRERWILFGTGGESTAKMRAIEMVRSEVEGKSTKIEIEYRVDDGETVPIYLVYTPNTSGSPENPPHLRIGAREDLWIPEKFADWIEDEGS